MRKRIFARVIGDCRQCGHLTMVKKPWGGCGLTGKVSRAKKYRKNTPRWRCVTVIPIPRDCPLPRRAALTKKDAKLLRLD